MSYEVASTGSGFSASTPGSQATSSDSAEPGHSSASGAGLPLNTDQRDGLAAEPQVLELPRPDLFLAPERCACCLAPAAQSYLVRGIWGEGIQVNYCEECLRHASAVKTRVLAVCLASSSLGITLAVALPVLAPRLEAYAVCGCALLGAILPVVLALVWSRRPSLQHSTSGDAVYFCGKSAVYCANGRYAKLAARKNGLKLRSTKIRRWRWSSWYWSGVVLTLVALPLSIVVSMAQLRVLNLTHDDYFLVVDGELKGLVRATSAESPAAGRQFRVGAGERRLTAISQEGALVHDAQVTLLGGAQHLFAPASTDTCFWIESTSYGRQKPDSPRRRELQRGRGFWVVPADIDSWFAPSPLPVDDDNRSSGGKLVALRQAPCSASPL